ncbi:MAG TPA: MBOAT family O-acyltransferase [Anaerolineales bacterium]|nr:MBOAT family O-acyltransferase [Anaerolineales bacterium]
MIFTSLTFWGFFALTFAVYWLLLRHRGQNIFLLLASYIFYGWFHPWYPVMLGASTLADFFLARRMRADRERTKWYMALSLSLNLGVLAFFKYYNFFNAQAAEALTSAGLRVDWLFVNIFLPAGLSFYTLKKLAYMIDVSRGSLEPSDDLVGFALFVSFFPQIVAGPIDRYQKLIPQIQRERIWQPGFFYAAWPLLVTGFFKKIVVADTLKSVVDRIFALSEPSMVLIIAGALGFTLEILADFSAYTDLSRGIAQLLGYNTSENFNKPYLSLTPTEFWNRWHITLSTWLRDYVFFPIRRALLKRTYSLPARLSMSIPPLVTMFISGLWHGAGLTFVVWGVYYGVLIAGYQLAGLRGDWKPAGHLKTFFAWLIMFTFIVFGWLIFRAPSMSWLLDVFRSAEWAHSRSDWVVALIILSMTVAYSLPLIVKHLLDQYIPRRGLAHSVYYAALTLGTVIFTSSVTSDFIYFQF